MATSAALRKMSMKSDENSQSQLIDMIFNIADAIVCLDAVKDRYPENVELLGYHLSLAAKLARSVLEQSDDMFNARSL